MVVPIGNHQVTLRIERQGVGRSKLARPASGFADDTEKPSGLIEHRDSTDEIRICHISLALGNIGVTIGRVGHHGRRIGERGGRISSHTRLSQNRQDLTFETELDDHGCWRICG